MNTHLLNLFLQIAMVMGLLSILLLLIMPTMKAFQDDTAVGASRSVLEISDSLTARQRLVITRAKNLLEQSAAAVIEVVAIGKGVNLMLHDTPYQQEIQSLVSKGVVFTVCQRSLQRLTETIGHPIKVLEGVNVTQDGRAYAEGLKENGYIDELA